MRCRPGTVANSVPETVPDQRRTASRCAASGTRKNPSFPDSGAIFLQASTRPCTDGDRFLEHGALGAVELDLDDALDALGADHHRHADIEILHAVFAVEPGGAGQHALLVAQIAFRHRDGGGRRRVEGRAGLEQVDDLGAAVARCVRRSRRRAPAWSSPSSRDRAAECRRPSNSAPAAPWCRRGRRARRR